VIELKDSRNRKRCARCGIFMSDSSLNKDSSATADHFIPQSYVSKSRGLAGNNEKICICRKCNGTRGNKVVLTTWYKMLPSEDIDKLNKKIETLKKTMSENNFIQIYSALEEACSEYKQVSKPTVVHEECDTSDRQFNNIVNMLLDKISIGQTLSFENVKVTKTDNGFNVV